MCTYNYIKIENKPHYDPNQPFLKIENMTRSNTGI